MGSKTNEYERNLKLTGHGVFAILAIMALWFWQERTLILDAAFQSYLFIATGQLAIMVERFGAAAVQLLPLAGVWAGAPLKIVLMLYSVSVVLFHWGLFSVCLHGLKDKKAAFAILLFNVLLVGDSFYWMQNELLQAVSLMFLMWSLWMRRGDWSTFRPADWVLSFALAATVIYYHPLIFFPLGFIWAWLWLKANAHPPSPAASAGENDTMAKRTLLAVAALFALIFSSKYIFRQPNFYDRGMTGQYVREFNRSPERLLQSQSLRDFVAHLNDNFILLLPLLAVITGFYIRKKRYWAAALAPAATVCYCLLIMQRFLNDDRWYIEESHYQALAVFLIVPLVWDVLPGLSAQSRLAGKYGTDGAEAEVVSQVFYWTGFTRFTGFFSQKRVLNPVNLVNPVKKEIGETTSVPRWLQILIVGLLLLRITGIWNTHRPYSARLAYVRSLLDKTEASEGRKFVIGEDQADRKTLMMYWGLPYETLQISALRSPDSVRVIAIAEKPDSLAAALSPDSMVTFLMIPPRAFRDWPPACYRMRDTSGWKKIRL